MQGLVFFCPGCHHVRAVQQGALVSQVNQWIVGVTWGDDGAPKDALHLTNGDWVMPAPLLLCNSCVPDGADATSLSEIGVRPR